MSEARPPESAGPGEAAGPVPARPREEWIGPYRVVAEVYELLGRQAAADAQRRRSTAERARMAAS